jgi:hypothetical protein
MSSGKDTIYIDVDDEITAIIEKVQESSSKILALVLPKRAAVFQSIVNMKLLKRTADQAKKNIVLITSETSLIPLAGAVGLHVAKTLQSKPAIPAAPKASDVPVSVNEADIEELEDTPIDPNAPIGQLAGAPMDEEETIEVDNDSDEPVAVAAGGAAAAKTSFNKKLKVPNFDQFRTRLILGITAAVLLIVFWIFAAFVWPKATITIKTDTTDVTSTVAITSSPSIKDVDVAKKQVPGILKEYKKTDSTKVPATGQKDMGTKASGSVTFSTQVSCSTAQPSSIPAGTTVSSGNFSFVTQTAAGFTFTGTTGAPPNVLCSWKSPATDVTAQNAGDSYNLSARSYSVNGFSGVSAAGSSMSGGTSKIVKVVSQQDIDNAKQKLVDGINGTANQEITGQLKGEGYFPITDTFTPKDPLVTANPAADTEADEVTVNVTISYTMAGAKEDGVKQILEADIKQHIDTSKQNVLNNGLDKATIRVDSKKPTGEVVFTLQAVAQAGVEQNQADIKQAVKGKKKGEAQSAIQSRPGVKDVQIKTSPFWVSKVPKKDSKITLIFEQQGSNASNGQ